MGIQEGQLFLALHFNVREGEWSVAIISNRHQWHFDTLLYLSGLWLESPLLAATSKCNLRYDLSHELVGDCLCRGKQGGSGEVKCHRRLPVKYMVPSAAVQVLPLEMRRGNSPVDDGVWWPSSNIMSRSGQNQLKEVKICAEGSFVMGICYWVEVKMLFERHSVVYLLLASALCLLCTLEPEQSRLRCYQTINIYDLPIPTCGVACFMYCYYPCPLLCPWPPWAWSIGCPQI